MIALVEVKNARVLTRDVALALYHDIAEGITVDAPYFLVLSQQLGFLWKQGEAPTDALTPTAEFPMASVVARYLPTLTEGMWLRGRELAYVVFQWLVSLTTGVLDTAQEPEKLLAATGFLTSIEGASVTFGTGDSDTRVLACT